MRSSPLDPGDAMYVYTDGASRGNPGAAACAYVFATPDGTVLGTDGTYLGETTNNRAEYEAVKLALVNAGDVHGGAIRLHSDSQLVINQLTGEWRVKSPNLKPLYDDVLALSDRYDDLALRHVPRGNAGVERADAHCNEILDGVGGRNS